jgi:hypothetical protein
MKYLVLPVLAFILFYSYPVGHMRGPVLSLSADTVTPSHLLRFDGVYRFKHKATPSQHAYCNYMRFYPDGQVIDVSYEGKWKLLSTWFTIQSTLVSKGHYEITRNRITFSTTSASGVVNYSGFLLHRGKLDLHVESQINGYITQRHYSFLKKKDLE